MPTKLSKNRKLILASNLVTAALVGLFVLCPPAYQQDAAPLTGRYVAQARDILRTLYPRLNGKGYILSISMPIDYDRPGDSSQNFELNIGNDYKEKIFGYAGGWRADKPRPKDFKSGPIHAQQYLTAVFIYTRSQLKSFDTWGSAVGDPEAEQELVQSVKVANREINMPEANAALKKAGAKYGLEDKEAFVRALPISKLEPFVGRLSITSVKLAGSDEDDNDVRASLWPSWIVLATARKETLEVPIRMSFEPFKGDLVRLIVDPDHP